MSLTPDDTAEIPIESVTIGDFVVSKSPTGDEQAWRVGAKKCEGTAQYGSVYTFNPFPDDPNHVPAVRAPEGTLIRCIRRPS